MPGDAGMRLGAAPPSFLSIHAGICTPSITAAAVCAPA
jgi:hypothetical protein